MSFQPCTTVVGVFHDQGDADRAVADLRQAGFRKDQLGIVMRDSEGRAVTRNTTKSAVKAEEQAEDGAVAGVVIGAGFGGLIGAGVIGGAIPVIGPAIAAGTLATILTNVAAGAAIAGLGGALIGWGLPEEQAKYYDGELKAGRVVITVHADNRCVEARSIMERRGGYSYESVTSSTIRQTV